jgi:hypothetical protein
MQMKPPAAARLSSEDVRIALRSLTQLATDAPDAYLKTGRCALGHFSRIGHRYPGAARICELHRGPREMIKLLERALQRHMAVTYPSRALNKNIGGGPSSREPEHVAYLVVFQRRPGLPVVEKLRTASIEPGSGPWALLTPGSPMGACSLAAENVTRSSLGMQAGRWRTSSA